MLGHSIGGYVTLAFAEKYSAMLKAFGLVHFTAFADNEEKKKSREKALEIMEKSGVYFFIKFTTPNLFSLKFKKNFSEKITLLIKKGKIFSVKTLQQYYKTIMFRKDRSFILREAKYPVLFIVGNEDVAVPLIYSL